MTSPKDVPTAAEAWIQHQIQRTMFEHAMGGAVDTGGLGAVALRFDHGLVNLAQHILPLTTSRRLRVSLAHNPRTGHLRENRGVGTDEIDGWVSARHVEIWNHSASHRGVVTTEDLMDEVVASIGEIEEQLPSAQGKVWGFNPPGIPGEDYAGFGKGSRPNEWTTEAGRIILAHHAVVSGHLSGTSQRLLDGQLRDGLAHVTMDARPVEDIIARIDSVARKKRGLQLMLHPSRLGMDGKLSIEGLTAVLDHLVDLRERREIATLSPYQLVLADARGQTAVR